MNVPILRPAKESDLPALMALAEEASFGLTSIPRNHHYLEHKIQKSLYSFKTEPYIGENHYLFFLEWEGKVIGSTAIIAQIGIEEPFYSFHLLQEKLHSPAMNIDREIGVLHFIKARKKPTEIGTLFLSPKMRQKNFGKLLSWSRFLFIATFKSRFTDTVVADMRGVNKNGVSPFWEAVGRPFFQVDFPNAYLLNAQHPEIIEELFPKHPLYLDLLPEEARACIGAIHENTIGAFKMLEKQGFKTSQYFNIFDGGPHVFAHTDQIPAVSHNTLATVHSVNTTLHTNHQVLISNTQLDFRATSAAVHIDETRISLHPDVAKALHVAPGDPVRYIVI